MLVTGASGFIGRACVARLERRGHDVVPVARSVPAWAKDPGRWRTTDLLRPGAPTELAHAVRATHVLHLAWNATPGEFWTTPDNVAWTRASLELLEACLESGARRVVAAGSVAEYGPHAGPCDEAATPCHPDTLYGASKDALRRDWLARSEGAGTSAAWGRVFHPFGPHEHPARLIPAVIRALLAGEPIETTDGRQQRDFVHVDDVAAAFVALMESPLTGAVNVVSGDPATLRHVLEIVGAEMGRPDLVKFGARPRPPGDADVMTGLPGRLLAETAWRPSRDLRAGLLDAIDWWTRARAAGTAG